jgi:hypothetical protein
MKKNETISAKDTTSSKAKIEEKSTGTRTESKEISRKSVVNPSNVTNNNGTGSPNGTLLKDTMSSKQETTTTNGNNNLMKKVSVIDHKEDTNTKITTSRDPLDKLKKEDLIVKVKEYEDKLKFEKEERKKQIEAKNKEIESKEKVIFTISGTNKKLVNELEDLKKEVDEKLDKIGLKQLKETEREIEMKKKQQPLEHVLKVKEKELKNALNLLEVIKKDKDNLQKNLNEKSDFNKVISLQDKLKEEENKKIQLETEIKLFQKLKDEHNKCENYRADFEKEKVQMMNEMKFLKEKNKELKNKMKEDEQKQEKNNKQLADSKQTSTNIPNNTVNNASNPNPNNPSKNISVTQTQGNKPTTQNVSTLPDIKNFDPKSKSLNKVSTSGDLQNIQKYWTLLESADKRPKDDTAIGKKKQAPKNEKEYKEFLSKERHKFSMSLQNKNIRVPESSERGIKLFGAEEKQILSKLLPTNEISKLEKKFEMIDTSKAALERKYAIDVKTLNKKVVDLEDRLEMILLQNKETEQKNKILSFQINEHKHENKILTKKIIDLNSKLKNVHSALNEKEEENKRIIKKLQESHTVKKEEGGNGNSRSYHESNMEELEEHEIIGEPTEDGDDEPHPDSEPEEENLP